MSALENPQWETFAQEVAKGSSLVRAYEKAGYEANYDSARANSSRLLSYANVSERVAELQELAAQRTLVTIDNLTTQLEEARELAMKDDKGAAAAVSAIMAKAKLHGLDVNKVETKSTMNVHILAEDERL